jgi:hypothetical protein
MRKTLLLAMILLVFAAWAVAQQGSTTPASPGSENTQAAQPAPSGNSIEGCLGGSAGNFTLTDKAGNTYQLQLPPNADTSKLSPHTGEEVRVTGTVGSRAGKQSINVTKMDSMGNKCGNKTSGTNPSK